jgi:glycosyltransferase involved in cell wall biosynthesis
VADGGLVVGLDAPLPAELAVGSGTALFVVGTCFAPGQRIVSLSLLVDGDEQPVMAHGMPRLDLLRARDEPTSYRSGFWGIARVPSAAAPVELRLRARLESGGEATAELGRIPLATAREPLAVVAPAEEPGPLVAICMTTFEPPLELLARQLDSIREQTHRHWVCVISDDCSSPERFAAIEAAVADDPRFVLSRSPGRLGFYRNFERALSLAPAGAEYIALSDQDDAWHPDKLATLLAEIGDARLIYSDARVIDRDGRVIAESYWGRRSNNHSSLLSLLVANSVTGAASLFPAALVEDALPFPPAQFAHFHDHWLALVALSLGDIAFVDRPLYDYVQHGDATLGHAAANRMPGMRERFAAVRRDPHERVRMWRMHYYVDVCRLLQFAAILRMRCGERMPAAKRRELDRFERADRKLLPLAGLASRGLGELLGRRRETLGAEWMLFHAFAWRRMLSASARDRPTRRLRLDSLPPTVLDPRPGARAPAEPIARMLGDKITPLRLAVRDDAPRRVNLLIPSIDLQHFFGGYIGKFNLARRLAARGVRVRIVTVDPVGELPLSWRDDIEAYSGLRGLQGEIEIEFGRESPGLEVSRADAFIATTWWTAHIAHAALRSVDAGRFLYLIQEYEPFTFPMGSHAALAGESYGFPHTALFSTELLRDYFRRHGLGVYAAGAAAGDAVSASFDNAITAIDPPDAAELAGRHPRRLLFYARPEPHAARNMFELGVLALSRALERGAFADGWSLHGIGTVRSGRRLDLGGGALMDLLPRSPQTAYGQLLREHDVGLALMYTPHPSLVPLEMASAAMLTVTNTFENKTAEKMAAISPNLIAAEPSIEAVAAALCEAAAGADDVERRLRGSAVRWPRDWDSSFGDELLTRVLSLLEG